MKTNLKRSAYAKRYYRVVYRKLKACGVLSDKYCKTLATTLINYSDCYDLSFDAYCKYGKRRGYSATKIINTCLIWGNTAQGYEFWYIKHCQLNQGINVHGETVGTNYQTIKDYINPF